MSKQEIDISEVKKLVELVETYGLEELTVEHAGLSVTVKGRTAQPPAPVMVHAAVPPAPAEPLPTTEPEAEQIPEPEPVPEHEGNIYDIVAPLVGVFYRSPAPDAPPFCEVGDTVEVGTEVGLIEAMKVFSSIPSEVAGVVVDIPAQNGKLVHEGDVLVRIRVSEEQNQ